MRRETLEYIKSHPQGYIEDLAKNIGEKEIEQLELLGFLDQGQDIKDNRRVQSYKVTRLGKDMLFAIEGKVVKGHLKSVLQKFDSIFLDKSLFR